jgi:hypothetical protein
MVSCRVGVSYCEDGWMLSSRGFTHARKTSAPSGKAPSDAATCKLSKFLLAREHRHGQYARLLIGRLPVSTPGAASPRGCTRACGEREFRFCRSAMLHTLNEISFWPPHPSWPGIVPINPQTSMSRLRAILQGLSSCCDTPL